MYRASWHTTEALIIPENISLMPLSPYSPELNPMEQVWQQLRKIELSNTCFKNYEDIVNSCCNAWNTFCDEEGNIRNLWYATRRLIYRGESPHWKVVNVQDRVLRLGR